MKRFSEQFKKKSDSIRMRASERRELRARIVSYMEYHPVVDATSATKRKRAEGIISEPFKAILINMTYVRSFAGVFALFLVVGVPFIAERSVPGDILYPVKIQFNEEVRSTLSLSPYAKVEWETQRLERRIAEARLLADEGKLTQAIEAEVAQAVKDHTTAAQKGIETMRESDSDGAAIAEITFASALAVQSEVLEGQVANDEANQTNPEGRSVVALAGVVAEARTNAENAQKTAPSFEKLLGRVEAETTRAYELFASVRTEASPAEVASIERRLADIERKVSQAIEMHSEQGIVGEEVVEEETEKIASSTEASASSTVSEAIKDAQTAPKVAPVTSDVDQTVIMLLRTALADTQKLLSFMTDIDIRLVVSIEELVPVTLTEEERVAAVEAQLAEALEYQAKIAEYEVTGPFAEKVIYGNTQLAATLATAQTALGKRNITRAEVLANSAVALGKDVLRMVADSKKITTETEKDTATATPDSVLKPVEIVEVEEEV